MPDRRTLALLFAATLVVSSCVSAPRSRDPVLVLGATGQLGAPIVRGIVERGIPVVALVRGKSDRRRLADLNIEYVTADVTNAAEMESVLKGRRYSAIVVALRVMDSDLHFYEKALGPISKHAKAAGVRQIIHHAAVGAGRNRERVPTQGWDRVPGMFDRLKDQGIGEDLVRASGVPYTIIRNARLYPDGTPSTGKAELTEDDTVLTPMTRADLARFTVNCLGERSCYNKTYHVRDNSLAWPPPGAARP